MTMSRAVATPPQVPNYLLNKYRVVGIDPSSRRLVAVVTGPDRELTFYTHKLPWDKHDACYEAFLWLIQIVTMDARRTWVFIEQPVMGRGGPGATIPQAQVCGALMAASRSANVPTVLVSVSRWKKIVCGKGNLDKAGVAQNMALVWPALVRQAEGDQDIIDAGAINRYGYTVIELRQRAEDRHSHGKEKP